MRPILTLFIFLMLFTAACNDSTNQSSQSAGNPVEDSVISPLTKVSLERETVADTAVARYSKRTDDPLNDWYFRVSVFETRNTFHYLMKLQFEEIRGEDTLKIPNLGFEPKVEIRKGPEKYSCIIGFLDKENAFREYKKVYVKNNALKVTTLRHYAVREITQ